jgi:MurNAc alpha-1-phosphate uridylyltransferase
MILAAGEGRRMRPLTHETPKPLLKVGGVPLLEHHLLGLRDAGVSDVVVNASYLGDQIAAFCGDGGRWGLRVRVSREAAPLETAGGIIEALPLLGERPFLVVNGDVYCDYLFKRLINKPIESGQGHLVLVDNPAHHPEGDFRLVDGRVLQPEDTVNSDGRSKNTLTFSGIALYAADFFAGYERGKRALKPLLDEAILQGRLSGEPFGGVWSDVGTPERLAALNA